MIRLGLADELGREGRLHDGGAGRQGQLEVGAVGDVGKSPAGAGRVGVGAGQGVDLGQVREGHVQSVEVDLRVAQVGLVEWKTPTGSVEGVVSAPRLVMAEGAHLQGRVDM